MQRGGGGNSSHRPKNAQVLEDENSQMRYKVPESVEMKEFKTLKHNPLYLFVLFPQPEL